MGVLLKNNAVSRLASSLATGGTSLSVTTGQGALFPSPGAGDWFPVTLIKASGALETVRCTARAGDVLTVVRAQEGTAAQAFTPGDRVELRITAALLEDMRSQASADAQEALEAAGAAQSTANSAKTTAESVDGLAVKRNATATTGAALMPVGTTAQRPAAAAGMLRYNSTLDEFERYQGSAWVPFNTMDKAFNEAPTTIIAAVSTTPIGAAASNTINITGNTAIGSFDNVPPGIRRTLIFQSSLTLVHSNQLFLPTLGNISVSAGDTAEFVSAGGANWRCTAYQRLSGEPLRQVWSREYNSGSLSIVSGGTVTLTHSLGALPKLVTIELVAAVASDGFASGTVLQLSDSLFVTASTFSAGVMVRKSTTQVILTYGSYSTVFYAKDGSGNFVSLTHANWRVVVRAYL